MRKLLRTTTVLLLAGLLAAGWSVTTARHSRAQSPITVDDWSTPQAELTRTTPGVVSNTITGTGILGVERDLRLALNAGGPVSLAVSGGSLRYTAALTADALALVTWDGQDGDALHLTPDGLGGLDLTSGGTQDAFLLQATVDATATLLLRAYTTADRASVYTLTMTAASGPQTRILRFADFTPITGTGATFAQVGALTLQLTATHPLHAAVHRLQTVALAPDLTITKTAAPDPAVAGRSLAYTLTVTNHGLTPAPNVVITDALPPGLTLHPLDQTDSTAADFDRGDYGPNTTWRDPRPWPVQDDDALGLRSPLTPTGVYTSRTFDALNRATWESLAWFPRRPYDRPLPDGGASEHAYPLGNADMTGNRLLLHAESLTYTTAPTRAHLINAAGLPLTATAPAVDGDGIPTLTDAGRFGHALHFAGHLSQTVRISDTLSPQRYALELWLRLDRLTDTTFILRTDSPSPTVEADRATALLGLRDGHFVHVVRAGDRTYRAVGTTAVQTATWYHLVGTAQRDGDLTLYVNGREEARLTLHGPLWSGGTHYRLAAPTTDATAYFSGTMDEIALYDRTLSASEIRDHYLRGALHLRFQVRACDTPTCDGVPFIGPGGLTTTTFTAQDAALTHDALPLTVAPLGLADGRYFQYRVALETEDPTTSPELQRVEIGPPHRAVTATQGSCTADAATFTCTLDALLPGQTVTVSAGAWIAADLLGTITNTAAVATDGDETTQANNTAALTTTVTAECDLALEKADDEHGGTDPAAPRGPLTYTLRLRNRGPSVARHITLTDAFTGTLITATADAETTCTLTTHTLTCTLPLLRFDPLEIVVTARAPDGLGPITNTAAVTAATCEPTAHLDDNTAAETTTLAPVADLSLAKTLTPALVNPAAPITARLTVANHGPYTATHVVLTDTLPPALDAPHVDDGGLWTCTWPASRTLACTLALPLPPGSAAPLTVTATAPLSGLLTNQARVTAAPYDPDPENNRALAFAAVRPTADLTLAKTDTPDPVYAGQPLTYTLTLTNHGPLPVAPLTTVVRADSETPIHFPLLPGDATPSPSTLRLAHVPGRIHEITVTLRGLSHTYPADIALLLVGPGGQSVVLMANVGGGTDARDLDLTFSDSGQPITGPLTSTLYRPTNGGLRDTFPVPGPYGDRLARFRHTDPNGLWQLYGLDTVYSDDGVIARGWQLEMSVVAAESLTLTDPLPAGTALVALTAPPAWTCTTAPTLTCTADTLPVGDAARFTVTLTAPTAVGLITNTADVTATLTDLHPSDNRAVVTTTVAPLADLSLRKQVTPSLVSGGFPLTFTLTVSNTGPVETALTLTEHLSPTLSHIHAGGEGWTCDLTALPALTCTRTAPLLGAAPPLIVTATAPITMGIVGNRACVTAPIPDPHPLDNCAEVTATVIERPIAVLTATNDGPTLLGGATHLRALATPADRVTYTWSLGDGTTAQGALVTHTYPTAGLFTATVTATNRLGSLTATTPITIAALTTARFAPPTATLAMENGGPITFTVTLDIAPYVTVTVTYTDGGTATRGEDYHPLSGTLTFAPGERTRPLHLVPIDDALDELNETVTLTLTSATPTATVGVPAVVTLTLADDDPTPALTVADAAADESAGAITFTLTLSATSGLDVSVDVATADGTARAGEDYTAVARRVTLPAGSRSLTLTVPLLDDAVREPDETFTLTLRHPLHAVLTDAEAIGTIRNDDNAPPVAVSDAYTLTEGETLRVTAPGLLNNDTDADGDPLTATLHAGPAHGTLALHTDGGFTYTPAVGFAGTDAFTYRAHDPYTASRPATVTLTVVPLHRVYLPLITHLVITAPDLIVERIDAAPDAVTVVIRNRGLSDVVENFWVDLYIAPRRPPARVNETWDYVGDQGGAWGVTGDALPLRPGERLTLTVTPEGGAYFHPEVSLITWTLAVGTPLWAHVDSADARTDYGAVRESHEIIGLAYNNILGPVYVTGRRAVAIPWSRWVGEAAPLPPRRGYGE